ncbi:MAG: PilW family protein [Deltaproteobacteria bacterium]|nr:MAG: PilW family protein [Deltaproteobacteria bacterium]
MGKPHKKQSGNLQQGFTLVELLVAMAMAVIVMAALYSTFKSQQDSYVSQEVVAEMQQNLRAALYMMARDIRIAGYDPSELADAGIVSAGSNSINFTFDINDGIDNDADGTVDEIDEPIISDGDVTDANENITYSLDTSDANNPRLVRDAGGGVQPVADYIDEVGFAYAFDNDGDDQVDVSAGGHIIWAIDSDGDGILDINLDTNDDGVIDTNDSTAGVALASQVDISRIRAVKIWLLARTGKVDRGFTNSSVYVVSNQQLQYNDNFRRRLFTTAISCRNMTL